MSINTNPKLKPKKNNKSANNIIETKHCAKAPVTNTFLPV